MAEVQMYTHSTEVIKKGAPLNVICFANYSDSAHQWCAEIYEILDRIKYYSKFKETTVSENLYPLVIRVNHIN
jgi:hypothetical protein